MSFGSATVGAAVGAASEIAYTTDGGQSWALATVPVTTAFQSVAFATPSIAVAGAATGDLLRSTDGGKTWMALAPVGTSSAAESIKFSSATTGFYVNGDGIRRSDDAGVTWTLIPGTSALHELDFGDAKHGVAVGPFGDSVMTSDGGDTWTKLASAQPELHSVSFAGTSTVVVLGQVIQRSTDGGKTWGQTIPTVGVVPPSNQLASVRRREDGSCGWRLHRRDDLTHHRRWHHLGRRHHPDHGPTRCRRLCIAEGRRGGWQRCHHP